MALKVKCILKIIWIDIQRIEIAEKYREVIQARAKENQIKSGEEFGKGCKISDKPIKPIDTKKELAKIAGVSHDTYSKGKKILEIDNEEMLKL